MKLAKIELKSFRSFVNLDLPLDAPRIFVAGLNNTGKSSVREAIKYVLTGRCQGLDGKGAGSDVLVPHFHQAFEPGERPKGEGDRATGVSASVTIDGLGAVERTWSPQGSTFRVQGWTGNTQSQQQALLDKLETTPAFLDAVLDSAVYLNLHHADSKAMVLSLLNVQIKLGDADDAPVMTLAEMDESYDQAFEDRKAAKTKLKGAFVPAKPADAAHPLLADIDALLIQRRKELADLNRQVGETSGLRNGLDARLGLLRRQLATKPAPFGFQAEIESLEERQAIMEADVTEVAEEKIEELSTVTRPAANVNAVSVETLRSRIGVLRAFQPPKGCIIDGKVSCSTHKLKFTNRAKDLEAEIESRGVDTTEPKSAPVASAPRQPNPITENRKALDDLKRQQAQYERDLATYKERETELEILTAELAGLPDTSDMETAVTAWQGKIAVGEQKRKDAAAYQQASQAHETGLQAQRALQAEVNRLEELCAVLGPSGVRVQALGSALQTFEEAVNLFTAPYNLTVKFQMEPWDVIVNDRPVRTYSESQRYRIGIAIQLAVAGLSGLRFAVIDQLDVLDSKKRDVMVKMLLKDAPVDQLIILATREAEQPLPVLPALPGLLVAYRLDLQDGRSVVVERSAA
jgi:hypothetical protein